MFGLQYPIVKKVSIFTIAKIFNEAFFYVLVIEKSRKFWTH